MFSRSLGRIAIRQPLRSTNGRIGSTVARRGLSTSGTSRNPTASKNATTLAIMALASGGVLYNFESMRSKKIYLEGENKSDSEEEKKELKEEKKKSGEGKSKSQKKKSEVKDEEKEESSKDNEKKEEVEDASPVDMDELSEDASQQSAFDPETNTINWDCPCLGGMAHGPCGEQFKEAFSCFVFSEEEVKGVDCIEKFKGMQDCFRKYPEHYKEELEDEAEFERSEAEQAKGDERKDKSSNSSDDDDEGLREWRAEMEKEK